MYGVNVEIWMDEQAHGVAVVTVSSFRRME